MVNAREEFKKFVGAKRVEAAVVEVELEDREMFLLFKKDGNLEEWVMFLDALDFEYDNKLTCPWSTVCGRVWFQDGTWGERVKDYSGEEHWELRFRPEIPMFARHLHVPGAVTS